VSAEVSRHRIPSRRLFFVTYLPDALLGAAWIWLLFTHPVAERLRLALLVALPLVVLYGILSIQTPSEVELDDDGITMRAYGRAHRFRWSEVTGTIRLRGFLVRDRVYLRIGPFHPWRGRYWLLDRLDGWPELVEAIRRRAG
jgi:hypothetical protein